MSGTLPLENKLKYTYDLLAISKDGFATVEYTHETLGKVIKTFFVPYDTISEASVRKLVAEQFPIQTYYSRHLLLSPGGPNLALISGELDISFTDRFYDIQVEVAKTVDV